MRYHKPFTPAQRQKAVEVCRAFGAQLSTIRSGYRPTTDEQKRVASELHRTVQDLVESLRAPDSKVDVERVNTLRDRADYLALHYAMLWLDV